MNNETLLSALVRIISKLPQIFSGFLSFAGLAYLIGWIKARAYYEELGAKWMVDLLSYKEVIGYSWMPLVMMAFITWVIIIRIDEKDDDDFRNLISKALGYPVLIIAGILYAATFIFGKFKLYIAADITNYLTLIIYLVVFVSALFSIIYLVRDSKFVGDQINASIVYLLVIAGIYFIPSLEGRMAAMRALDSDRTRLPLVKIKDRERMERMILVTNDSIYTILNNDTDTTLNKIHIYSTRNIEEIMSSKWKKE